MNFQEQFEALLVECQFMGGWLQRNNYLTHVSSGLSLEISEGLAARVEEAHEKYRGINRVPEAFIFTFESARVIVLSLAANRCGLVIPRTCVEVDVAAEKMKQLILLNTLELLQAPALCDLSARNDSDSLGDSDPDFESWDTVLCSIKSELTKIMNAGQVDMFIKIRLKGFEVQTKGDARTALSRISEGVPDKSKANLLFESVNAQIASLS